MDIEQARFNMIEQQIRPWEVLDQQVLNLMSNTPREHFVPDAYQGLAFADINVPLGDGETMLPPKIEARMLQALAIQKTESVLEIGTGSGFMTALLAKSAHSVYSMDIRADFLERAGERLAALNIENVSLEATDALVDEGRMLPYDVIAVTGSVPVLPEHWKRQLSLGGRLFVVVGQSPVMTAQLITRISANEWRTEDLFETEIPALQGAPKPAGFVF